MKSVLMRGPVLTQSGYGVHARQVSQWLLNQPNLDVSFQALPWGDTPWLINHQGCNGLVGRIMDKTVDPTGKIYDVTLQLQLPNEWDPRLGRKNIGITAAIETDRCNPSWIKNCNDMDAVIVPSKHSASSLTSSGNVTKPLYVIPESYSEAIVDRQSTTIDTLELSTKFNFLLFGQITGNNPENDRKNIFYTIKWFCEVFKDDRDVGLVVKTNSGRNTTIDRKIVTQTLEALIREVRKGMYPRIHLLHGELSDHEVASLYRHPQIKALVSLTRGEGYGLPILEAAASDLPVITTGWSGHVDFLSEGKFIEVDYKLDTIHSSRVDNKIFMSGSRWATPSEDDFKKKIVKFRSNNSIPSEWARGLGEKLRSSYSLQEIEKMYTNKLGEFLC
ncbi:MAG: glycosyltransferase [Caulobacteraceae bacterium]|nr:glycosyltransferase [Caulobacteraceae bacterium]